MESATFTVCWDSESLHVICDVCGIAVMVVDDADTRDHATDNTVSAEPMFNEMQLHAYGTHGQLYQL